jgi:hypothetical protein
MRGFEFCNYYSSENLGCARATSDLKMEALGPTKWWLFPKRIHDGIIQKIMIIIQYYYRKF